MNEFILRDPNISFLPNPHITTRLRWEFGLPAGQAKSLFEWGRSFERFSSRVLETLQKLRPFSM